MPAFISICLFLPFFVRHVPGASGSRIARGEAAEAVQDDEEGDVQDQEDGTDQQEQQNPAPVSRSRIYGARRRSPEDINAAIAAAAGGRGRGYVRGRGGSGSSRLPPGPSTVMTRSRSSRRGRKD